MRLLDIDRDAEARKHLWFGLKRLSQRQRVAFLEWTARQATHTYRDHMTEVKVTDATGSVRDIYFCLLTAIAVHRVDIMKVCNKLESVLRTL